MIPIRLEMANGETKWRGVPRFDHATLCRAFELDQATFWFDIPDKVIADPRSFPGRRANGYVMCGPKGTEPVGKLTIAHEGEKFRDVDPFDRSEFMNLSRAS